jgi:hypothetical protein
MSGLDLHGPWHYEQETDPGVVGGGKWWLKKSSFQISRRNDTNTGWDVYFQGGGTSTQSANRIFAGPASGSAAAPTFRAAVPADIPVMIASGATHAAGLVPDPGVTAGSFKLLREDATFAYPRQPYINVQDQKAQNTAGGTFTSGAWQTRTLNTTAFDTASISSLSSNQVTLPAGTYRCFITCPAANVQGHQARLQNITDATTLLTGTSEWTLATSNGAVTRSLITGEFTLAASKALSVQHQCFATFATQGFGLAANIGTEVYTVAEFWRLA